MMVDDVDRLMLKCPVCGTAWDEHPGWDAAPCVVHKPKYVGMMGTLRAENARLMIELEEARGEIRDLLAELQDLETSLAGEKSQQNTGMSPQGRVGP